MQSYIVLRICCLKMEVRFEVIIVCREVALLDYHGRITTRLEGPLRDPIV